MHKLLIPKQSEMKIKEIKKARSTYVGHYRGISFYTNPAVKDGVVWYINENQIYRK